jgi:hypothetical protein
MAGEELKIQKGKLPLIYRLFLKLPVPSLDFLPDFFQGIYWVIIMPIFLTLEFFLSLFLLVSFSSPANILLTCSIPTVVLIIFLRISLERFINWWNAIAGEQNREWNLRKAVENYIVVLEKQRRAKKP